MGERGKGKFKVTKPDISPPGGRQAREVVVDSTLSDMMECTVQQQQQETLCYGREGQQ